MHIDVYVDPTVVVTNDFSYSSWLSWLSFIIAVGYGVDYSVSDPLFVLATILIVGLLCGFNPCLVGPYT